jgi:general secretion pathway protein G
MPRTPTMRSRVTSPGISSQAGMTLIELIITCAILVVLSSAALPIAKHAVIRRKEAQLRHNLREVREAIDRYKDAADHNQIKSDPINQGYPPSLQTLVEGVALGQTEEKKIVFLRAIPTDPMTGQPDWGLRSVEDDYDSQNWDGKNVFDIYSKSTGTAMDGTKYTDW